MIVDIFSLLCKSRCDIK